MNVMDDQSKDLLIGLRIISNIPIGGKLNTSGSEISIYMSSWKEWIIRKYQGDGEPKTRIFLKRFYTRVDQRCRSLLITDKSDHVKNVINSFIENIKKSLTGLEKLRNSYKDNATMISNIGFILEDIINPLLKLLYEYKGLEYKNILFKDDILVEDASSSVDILFHKYGNDNDPSL